MEGTLLVLYCLVDEFCRDFLPQWESPLFQGGLKKRRRETPLSPAEIMTLCIHFHQSHYRTFKHYYLDYVKRHLQPLFSQLVSYERFVMLMKSMIVPLCVFLQTLKGEKTGIYFVDSLLLYGIFRLSGTSADNSRWGHAFLSPGL